MPLLFTQLCDLLSALEDLSLRDPPLLPARLHSRYYHTLKSWFTTHRVSINSPDIDVTALLSALFPAKRKDRVYNIQLKRLTRLLKRCLCLGTARLSILDQWQLPGRGGLADCVERALQVVEFPLQRGANRVTLEWVDQVLATIAGRCRFSGPKARQRKVEDDQEVLTLLGNTYQRMQSREAKWFTRLILKDLSSLDLVENMVYEHIDPRLRVALQMYDDVEAAITELRGLPASQMIDAGGGGFTRQCANDAHLLRPRIGIKIGPPKWVKAKGGVKHAIGMIGGRNMSVERKHDGEYCQIHIDLSRGEDCIQIFSKSGKDSTVDRCGVHEAIKKGLRIGRGDCGFSGKSILEGELLVWSEKTKTITDFHKIRKHVSRSGSFLGTTLDSQPHPWERLMIMFYDVMLIDDDSVLHKPQRERRRLLEKLVMPIEGKVGITWQKHVQFSKPDGPKRLKEGLAHAFVHRWEGLVLKPSDEPYFDLGRPVKGNYSSRWIKLKKDCIRGLGDSADFVVVGAGYDVTEAFRFTNLDLKWTHFYIGCLRNKVAVVQSGMKPNFLVFDKITECITEEDLVYLNQHGQFPLRAMEPTSVDARETYDVEFAIGLTRPKVIFRKPFVVDVAGSGFDKSSNRDIFTLRFPRVLKVHRDRDWRQAVGLDELQMMATAAMTIPKGDVSEELAAWVEKLDRLDRGVNGQTLSWDYTDNEDEDSEASRDKGPKVTTAKSPRRARTPMAPPLVRMDTGEMLDQEQRLGSGEVVERPRPKHVVDSIPRDNSLQTPPELLPVSRRTDATSEQSSPPGIWRKRTIDSAELQEGPTIWKKSRPSLLQSKSEPQRTKGCNTAAYKKPLGEITNSARSSLRYQSTQLLPQTKQLSATEFSFVGKIAVGADEDFHSRRSKRRMVMEPLSPARETTASESTLTATTQQTTLQHAASTPLPSPTGQRGQAPFIPTPVSSAERSTKEDMRDLKKRQLIVSPCLMDGDHPLQVLMARHSIVPSSLPNKTPCPACAPPEHSIIFLVEPNNTGLTGSYIRSLVRHIPAWHPRSIRVWDWRIVEAMLKSEIGNVQDSKKRVKEAFFAKLSWDPEEELVEVQWRDGEPSWVPKEDLERADWSGR